MVTGGQQARRTAAGVVMVVVVGYGLLRGHSDPEEGILPKSGLQLRRPLRSRAALGMWIGGRADRQMGGEGMERPGHKFAPPSLRPLVSGSDYSCGVWRGWGGLAPRGDAASLHPRL